MGKAWEREEQRRRSRRISRTRKRTSRSVTPTAPDPSCSSAASRTSDGDEAQRGLLGQRPGSARDLGAHLHADQADATRVAALLSGEVDFVQDVPVQDIERLQGTPNLASISAPENRSIFFGMDVGIAELKTSDVRGKNPFAEKRVRQAINMAINRAGHPARRDARSIGAGRHHRPAVRQWLHEGARRDADGSTSRRPRRYSPRPAIRTGSR